MTYYYVSFTNDDVEDSDYAFSTHEEAVIYLWRALMHLLEANSSYRDISIDELYNIWYELEETDRIDNIGCIKTITVAHLDWEYNRGFVVSDKFEF